MGSNIVLGQVGNAHAQAFLREHDEEVCVLAQSPSGAYLASAQLPSTSLASAEAPIVLWHHHQLIARLDGFTHVRVSQLAFSPDARFLAAAAVDGRLIIWDVHTTEVVVSKVFQNSSLSLLQWSTLGPDMNHSSSSSGSSSRRPRYTLVIAHSTSVLVNTLAYDLGAMTYLMTTNVCQLPSSGLIRDYLSSTLVHDHILLTGTATGEIIVYDIEHMVFRGIIPLGGSSTSASSNSRYLCDIFHPIIYSPIIYSPNQLFT